VSPLVAKGHGTKEVSRAHLIKEVDVGLLDSSPHKGIFGFLLLKKDVGAPPTAFLSKKGHEIILLSLFSFFLKCLPHSIFIEKLKKPFTEEGGFLTLPNPRPLDL
jgi:hypothetical protein